MASAPGATHDRSMRLALFATCTVLAGGCGVTDFDISQDVPEQQIAGSPLPGPLGALFPIPLSLDLSAEIAKRDSGPIDSVTLSGLSLAITATDRPGGDADDWGFVAEIHVFVKSSAQGSTLPRVEIASARQPGAVTTLEFDVDTGVNLKPYVDEGSIVEGSGSGDAPADDVSYDGKGVFTVHPL